LYINPGQTGVFSFKGKIMANGNLKLAVQKTGRLSEKSLEMLKSCGLEIDDYGQRLLVSARNYEIDILFLRDDDIPEYVQDGVADIGIVGENVMIEKQSKVEIIKRLGFSKCKLLIAVPEKSELKEISQIKGKTIATSYPNILRDFLKAEKIDAKIIEISGSVEIAPSLGVADMICDIVSTGNTLKMNQLKKSFPVFDSEAVLIKSKSFAMDVHKQDLLKSLLIRIDSVLTAKKSKYLMMNVPKRSLDKITRILPSVKSPTVLPLADGDMVAVHAVIPAETFWEIQHLLKNAGASGILLLQIDNMII
jgi:ATP phosphoribosyltransferase